MRTNRKEKRAPLARRAANRPAAQGPDFLKVQLLELCEIVDQAAVAIRACDLDVEGAQQHLDVWVHKLSVTAMRVQTIGEALEVRAKLKAATYDLCLLSVKEDDEDDVYTRVMRPMLAEARRGLAEVPTRKTSSRARPLATQGAA